VQSHAALLFSLSCCATSFAAQENTTTVLETFKAFSEEVNITFGTQAEFEGRASIFADNLRLIAEANNRSETYFVSSGLA